MQNEQKIIRQLIAKHGVETLLDTLISEIAINNGSFEPYLNLLLEDLARARSNYINRYKVRLNPGDTFCI